MTQCSKDKQASVTTARSTLRLQIEDRPPICREAANILNKQSWTSDKGCYFSLGVGRQLLNIKTDLITEKTKLPWARTDRLVQHKQLKKDMIFGMRNVRSLYRVGSLTAAVRELVRHKLDLVHVQGVR
jgi:hypothetical protein